MTFSADSVSSVHTLHRRSSAGVAGRSARCRKCSPLIPPEGLYIVPHAAQRQIQTHRANITVVGGGDITRRQPKLALTVVDKQNESVEVIGIQSEKLSRYLERLHTAGLT